MSRLFSATEEGDEELTEQVANDIEGARKNGSVDTDEVHYEDEGDGKVSITDKENGEVTIAERAEDGNYDLYPAQVTENLAGYLHPEMDGVTPGQQIDPNAGEDAFEHIQNGVISPNVPGYGLNPQAGFEPSVEGLAECGPEGCDDEREFSVSTDNTAVLKIFSSQAYWEKTFSEVIESEETAKVGDIKVEKDPDEENTVIVTNITTGDQAKVTLEENEMEVTELDSKNFCGNCCEDEGQYEALHVVGVDPNNHVIVDAPEYEEESAQELAGMLTNDGVQGVQIFDNPEDARSYAFELLENLGAESEDDIEEPQQVEYSDHSIYVTRYYSSNTKYMDRLFSESSEGVEGSQEDIEDAIESGEEIENDNEIITPVDSETAIVEDKNSGEFTKVTLDGDELDCKPISKAEADELTENLVIEDENADEDEEEDEKEFSEDIYYNDDLTKFFSEDEYMTDYMTKIFSDDENSEEEIVDAIESGEQVENDDEVITPIDNETAVVEDKESGEFTKATLDGDSVELKAISEDEADELTENLKVENKEFSEDMYYNDDLTKFFSEDEILTDYMVKMFSDDDDNEEEIADAIESGEQIENDDEVITPVNNETAVIEDKESGEFTKATLDEDGEGVELKAISEEEADELTKNIAVEDNDNDEDEDEKEFSEYYCYDEDPILDKFFADAIGVQEQAGGQQQLFDAQGNPVAVMDEQGNIQAIPQEAQQAQQGPSLEVIEDTALQAVNQIQQAAQEASNMIMQAKEAPVANQEQDLQEAQFSERAFSELGENDTLVSWLNGNQRF
jgi:hypothetical protein